jgi:chromosome segregation ATPase
MFQNTGDQEAQMLAQIKALPEGDMKNSLLDTFVKIVKTEQRNKNVEPPRRKPLFIDSSFDRNTNTFTKFNREAKLQNTSITDLAKEILLLKKEISELKEKFKRMEEEAEYSFKIDSWARQEIRELKEKLDSIPPPLEDTPFESPKSIIQGKTTAQMKGLTGMKIMPIRYKKHYVRIKLEINREVFI